MKTEEGRFTGIGDVEIFHRSWAPEAVRAVCLISHGLGEHCGRYHHVAQALCGSGVAAAALDHRGHGKSGGRRGHIMSFNEYLSDLHTLRAKAEALAPGKPLFLLGHSMGGLIAVHYALEHGQGLKGFILSSAALKIEANAPAIKLALGRMMSKVLPALTLGNGLDPNQVSRDPEVVKAYIDDPLVHDRVSARWFTEFTAAIGAANARANEISIPALVMQSGADGLVVPAGAPEFFGRLGSPDKTFKMWDGFYHEMFNEPEKQGPISLLLEWIEKRAA